jgi:heat shock protein HslJ
LQRIADRTWSLTHFTQDGRDIPFAASARLTLWLRTQDGSMGGNACPFLTGTYVANGATLRLQPHRNHSIQVRCTPATALLQLEYLGALQIVETYRVENGSLTLASADGRLQLIFTEDPCVTTWLPQARGAPIGVFSGTPPPATPCPAG